MFGEVEKLIKENSLLRIGKNDLKNQVEKLNIANGMLREENLSRQMASEKMNEQVLNLEKEVKSLKEKLSDKANQQKEVYCVFNRIAT
uniref:JIP_LZII domain-containing protein n=1 Tax=Caenorhabditis japonica TaxID=281687 RepID=A0A8R1DMG0_CAEJA